MVKWIGLLAGTAACALGTAAGAQQVTAAATAAPQPADNGGLEEIVVTAEKREGSLQRTPLAISAVSSDLIQSRNITSAAQLGAIAPNITTTLGPNSSTHLIVHIRGIGESEPILTSDPPVSIYVDGIVVGRSTGAVFDIVDLERIEVLRGPQGTLYGRNTTGGAVNFITRKPGDEFGVRVMAGYGNYDSLQGRISVDTGSIGGTGLKATLAYMHKQRDGYVDSVLQKDSKDPGAFNNEAARVALAYDDGGPFRANYAFDWFQSKAVAPASQLAAVGPNQLAYFSRSAALGGTALIGPSQTRLDTIRSEGTFTFDKTTSHSLTLEADLTDDITLRSLTGFRRWRGDTANTDIDGNAGLRGLVVSPPPVGVRDVGLFGADKFNRQRQFTQELNLIGTAGPVDYVLGGFYFRERAREDNPQYYTFVVVNPLLPGGLGGANLTNRLIYRTRNVSKAAFGQLTWHITDSLTAIGGLRYTEDEKRLVQASPANLVRTLNRNFDKLNYAATLQYQINPETMVYGRVATGYKAGGFNARSVNNGYDPESVTNYEVGAKTSLFDRRLRLNATLFYAKLDDKQLNQFLANTGGAASVTVNAGSAEFKGIELEVEALPIDALRLNASFGYTDRNFKTFNVVDPATNLLTDVSDEARFSYSASTTFTGGAQYTVGEVFGGQLSARLDYTYRSKLYFNVVPRFAPFDEAIRAKGVGLLDGRLALGKLDFMGNRGEIALWAKNLTKEKYRISGIDFGSLGFATNTYGTPRTYGAEIRMEF
ncbi:TonB-dependent receptor [Sphingomonas jatrophae]|uniref:Iron complex outermembrane recepter protein n=1 Tax=Sphingomonas jatrophae TaxID=1166337 RepID=A0A1I6KJU6_9SPHN|nr:TonB-dependent receptor [Sphingomonas jatrophae]SFR91491.1 iron complex outermembrane recepter protein [Sphingomonas jatrophae]